MNINDIKKLKASGESINRKRSFFMSLVYFNGAKNSLLRFREKIAEFDLARDRLTRNIKELKIFCSANEGCELTHEIKSYIEQWPEGRGLDVEGAMEEMHPELAESLSHYFNFLTNCVASVESCVNQEIAKLLFGKNLKEHELKEWIPKGIGHRPKHLLEWKGQLAIDDAEIFSALVTFQKVVECRNNFVHYKSRPVAFTYSEINIANVAGDENANIEFCSVALESVCQILNRLVGTDLKFIFEPSILGFQPNWSPSPYLNFHHEEAAIS